MQNVIVISTQLRGSKYYRHQQITNFWRLKTEGYADKHVGEGSR